MACQLGSLETDSQKVIHGGGAGKSFLGVMCVHSDTGMCTHTCGPPTTAGAHTCSVVASMGTCDHTDAITCGRRRDPWACVGATTHLRTPTPVEVMSKVESGERSDLGSIPGADT